MIAIQLENACPDCGSHALSATLETAAHDDSLIDLVVTCTDCGAIHNDFIKVSEMMELNA